MQSDLSSASTALRLDQATTDSFPASLALANNGRGIAPSQSMDDIIYVPDNTSNPKNFCLQYRKGTNTYAVDATTQPAKGVCLQNLIINGNFSVDGNGDGLADNYSANGVTSMSLAGNIQTYLSISQYSALSNIPQPYITTAHIFYTSVYVDSVGVGLYIYQGTGGSWGGNSHSAVAGFERLVVRTNIISSVGAYIYIQDNRSSGFTPIRVKKWITIDLTDTFGAGNEPSQATMDSILSAYPDSWFNIVAKANL
jgi:hypothetical protein